MKNDITTINYKGLSERTIDFIWRQAEELCPNDPEKLVQGLVNETVKRNYPRVKSFESRVFFAIRNDCDI